MIADISIPFAKTLKPSMEEFVNFEQFVENCDKDKSLQACGCFKVTFYSNQSKIIRLSLLKAGKLGKIQSSKSLTIWLFILP
mgnify:CR=1 FL=1